jgi:hypothetical protein
MSHRQRNGQDHVLAEPDQRVHARERRIGGALREREWDLHEPVVAADAPLAAEDDLGGRRLVEQAVPRRDREAVQARRDRAGEEQRGQHERLPHRRRFWHL